MADVIANLIEALNRKCVEAGHYWAPSSLHPGTEYCQACGAHRQPSQHPAQQREP